MSEIKTPLLTFAQDAPPDALAVDVDGLIKAATGAIIYGQTGSGKSHTIRGLLEQTADRIQQIILDVEGEFATLRAVFPYLLAAPSAADVVLTVGTARALCRRIMETGASVILDIHELTPAERVEFVAAFVSQLIETPLQHRRPCLVVVDEAHRFAPQGGKAIASLDAIADLCARGRKRGLIPILGTQRIAKLNKDAAAELPNKLVGKVSLDVDKDRASDDLGLRADGAAMLSQLQRGQFYALGPWFGDVPQLVHSGTNKTAAPEMGQAAPPPAQPSEIADLLTKFADLPADQDETITTLAQAKRRISELKAQLSERRSGPDLFQAPAPQVIERIVEKRVEVPVLTPEALDLMQTTGATASRLIALLTETAARTAPAAPNPQKSAAPREPEPAPALPAPPAVPAAAPVKAPKEKVPITTPEPPLQEPENVAEIEQVILAVLVSGPAVSAAWISANLKKAPTGAVDAVIRDLRTSGKISLDRNGKLTATLEGRSAAPRGAQRIAILRAILPKTTHDIYTILANSSGSMTRIQIADRLGISAQTGNFSAHITMLKNYGLITEQNRKLRSKP